MRRFDDFAACEDAVQEALLAAATQWPRTGTPDEPRAWLIRVASRRMIDHLRGEAARRRREAEVAREEARETAPALDAEATAPHSDDRLILLFMCCHESLTPASAIALTLRAVGGLTTAEIASAFMVPEATMGQRISRAKRTIRESGVPFRLPESEERSRRLGTLLHALYLMFNEGYTSSFGPTLQRSELTAEAIRLARAVYADLPADPEVGGLLALMLLTDSRRAARTGPGGELIPLTQQDRGRWDRDAIEEGTVLLDAAMARGRVGPYQLQAAIAALHDAADSVEETDWPQILALYGVLERMSDNPMVTLNRAVATAMVHGPSAGLALLDALADDRHLGAHHRLDAVRAHLLELAGDAEAARRHYRMAASRATNAPERDYLLTRAARLRE
jgi:RNA polymerase sigma factor (sigma-70 family)